jgi:hypothetical protein
MKIFLSKIVDYLVFSILILMCLFYFEAGTSNAQTTFSTGLIDEDPAEFEKFPESPTYRAFLPEKVDLSSRMPPVGDQGRQGSCVGWAVGYAARSYYTKASDKLETSQKANQVSPGYVYDSIRRGDCERGSRVSDALELLRKGALSFDEYVYDDNMCRKPTPTEQSGAKKFKIKGWRRVNPSILDQVKGALAQGHPLIIAGVLDPNFHRLRRGQTWKSGKIDWDKVKSGHAFTLVGYNDRRKHFKVLNSWGTRWGTRGYANMTYETFKNRIYATYQIVPLNDPEKPHKKVKPTPDPTPKPAPQPEPAPEPVKLELPVYECSRLKSRNANGQTQVFGFVSSENDLKDLKSKVTGDIDFDVNINPWPQCEALLIVQNGQASSAISGIDKQEYKAGELLSFNVQTPEFSSHVHLAYFQADGSVVNLSQSAASNLVTHAPSSRLTFGDGKEGRAAFNVQGPFGNEMVLAITTKSPLFDEKRPLVETEREFLSALREATIELEETTGLSRFYAASSVILQTKE